MRCSVALLRPSAAERPPANMQTLVASQILHRYAAASDPLTTAGRTSRGRCASRAAGCPAAAPHDLAPVARVLDLTTLL